MLERPPPLEVCLPKTQLFVCGCERPGEYPKWPVVVAGQRWVNAKKRKEYKRSGAKPLFPSYGRPLWFFAGRTPSLLREVLAEAEEVVLALHLSLAMRGAAVADGLVFTSIRSFVALLWLARVVVVVVVVAIMQKLCSRRFHTVIFRVRDASMLSAQRRRTGSIILFIGVTRKQQKRTRDVTLRQGNAL